MKKQAAKKVILQWIEINLKSLESRVTKNRNKWQLLIEICILYDMNVQSCLTAMARAKRVPSSSCGCDDACVVHKRVFNTLECEHTIDFDFFSQRRRCYGSWKAGAKWHSNSVQRFRRTQQQNIQRSYSRIMSFSVHSRIISLRTNSHIMTW